MAHISEGRKQGGIAQLDGLRGLAALIVVVSHFSKETSLWGDLLGNGAGQTGVMLFFLLSGFLMAYLHIDQPFTAKCVSHYVLRRVARVYPLFLIVGALPPMWLALHSPGGVARNAVTNLGYYLRQMTLIDQGWGIFWTIRVELFFYAVFIGIWLLNRFSLRYLHGRWATVVVLAVWLAYLRIENFNFRIEFFTHVHYFLFGVLSALAWRRRAGFRNPVLSAFSVAMLFSIPFTFPQVWVQLGHAPISEASQWMTIGWTNDWVALGLIAFFQVVLRDKRWLYSVLASKPLRWLGKVSYSTYILHFFVITPLLRWIPAEAGNLVRFVVCIAAVLIVSALSHRWVERPLQNLVLRLPELLQSRRLTLAH
jgi:peptidoglycan/LPS O-acetylase OafA/YrhL